MSAELPFDDLWAASAGDSGGGGSQLTALLRSLGDKVEQHQRKIRAQQELIVELVDAMGALATQLQAQASSPQLQTQGSSGSGNSRAAREAPVSVSRPVDHRDSAYCPPNTYYDIHQPLRGRKTPATVPIGPSRRTARRPPWDPTPLRPQPQAKTQISYTFVTRGPPRKRGEASSSLAALQAELQRHGGPGRR